MNFLDRVVAAYNPVRAVQRAQARRVLSMYEGAKPSKQRRRRADNSAPNVLVGNSAAALRAHARALERDHDICRGALRVMVNSVVGPGGIAVEPQPRRADGSIHTEYATALREAWRKWQRKPEVTGRYRWSLAQRMAVYTWLRDGEMFAQKLLGPVPFLKHGSNVPLSLELFEADFVPLDYDDLGRNIRQGIQSNAWGEATNYLVYKGDPRDGMSFTSAQALKTIPAERMMQLASLASRVNTAADTAASAAQAAGEAASTAQTAAQTANQAAKTAAKEFKKP